MIWFSVYMIGFFGMFIANQLAFHENPLNDTATRTEILADFIGSIILGIFWPIALAAKLFLKLMH